MHIATGPRPNMAIPRTSSPAAALARRRRSSPSTLRRDASPSAADRFQRAQILPLDSIVNVAMMACSVCRPSTWTRWWAPSTPASGLPIWLRVQRRG